LFYLHYIFSELRGRKGRTILTSLGLAVGVGLVVAVTALSSGLDKAQSDVLEPLTGVGTDMSVSRPIIVESDDGEQDFSAGPGAGLSSSEQKQLEKENGRLSLDFSKYGDPGDKFTTRQFQSTDLSFPEKEASKIAEIGGVSEVGKALTLNQITISGTVPSSGEQQTGFGGPPAAGGDGGGDQTGLDQATVTGVDAKNADVAPVTEDQVIDGDYLPTSNADVAMLSQSYANSNSVDVGDKIKVGDRSFKVVGIVKAPLGGETSDFYVPLKTLQKMSDREGRINVLHVRADSSDNVESVSSEIESVFKGSDVTTAQDLADRVSGSLVDAKNLSSKLGTALAAVALLAAFGIASLLTLSSVNKRIREIGTLKALGWSQWLVVRQISGESVTQGLIGGLVGAAIGIGGAAIISSLGISLDASVEAATSGAAGPFGQGAVESGTSAVSLTAPVDAQALLLAIALAMLGGLIAGAVGGLRAARLRPAEALRSVE
jgi:ABC-type antimicrobial peptide transport system permease subunit